MSSNGRILNSTLSQENEALRARIAQLEAAAANRQRISFKVTEKGAVSVYGLQRFPVTLYAAQWERLATAMPEIVEFIKGNSDKVARK